MQLVAHGKLALATLTSLEIKARGTLDSNERSFSVLAVSASPNSSDTSISGSWDTGEETWNTLLSPIKSAERRFPSQPTVPYMMSMSYDGSCVVCASRHQFVISKIKDTPPSEYEQIGQGSGCEEPSEFITACLCISLYVPSKSGNNTMSIVVAIGYSSGYLRFFDEKGVLIISQQLHNSRVQSIRARTVVSFDIQESDEILVSYKDKHAISIDGTSLWMAARFGQLSTEDAPALSYKKWIFQSQEQVVDIISCGPLSRSVFSPPQFNKLTGEYAPVNYTARYIAVGKPMVALYATTETSRSLFAGIVPSRVTSAVTSAVFSFAKTLWNSPNQPSSVANQSKEPSLTTTPGVVVPAVIVLSDSNRHILSITQAPSSVTTPRSSLAVMSDSLGRVLVLDTDEGEIIRIFKGVRDAQTAWIQVSDQSGRIDRPVLLVLAIYSSRGVLELYLMRFGQRICIANVGTGIRLVQTTSSILGGMYWRLNNPTQIGALASCYLVSSNGEMRKIVLNYDSIINSNYKAGDTTSIAELVSEYENLAESTSRTALLSKIKDMVVNLSSAPLKFVAMDSFSNAVPVETYFEILEHLAKLLEVENQSLTDVLQNSLTRSKIHQQSQDVTNRIETTLRLHILKAYQAIQEIHMFHTTKPVSDTEISNFIQDEFCKLQFILSEKTDYAKLLASATSSIGFRTFQSAFVLNKRWVPSINEQHAAPLKLNGDLTPDIVRGVAKFLLNPILSNRCAITSMMSRLLIGRVDWMTLIVSQLQIPCVSTTSVNIPMLQSYANLIQSIVQIHGTVHLQAVELLTNFAMSTKSYALALFVCLCLHFLLDKHNDRPELQNLIASKNNLKRILVSFEQFFSGSFEYQLPCAAKDFEKTEKTSLAYLVALSQLKKIKTTPATIKETISIVREYMASSGLFETDLGLIYISFYYADQWIETSETDALSRAVCFAQSVSSSILQQGLLLALFNHCFSTKLRNIIDMIEKARRVPKDVMCERLCGMPAAKVSCFLEICIQLLEALDIPGEAATLEDIEKCICQLVFKDSVLTSNAQREFLNGACGMMMLSLGDKDQQSGAQEICRRSLARHILMSSILRTIFIYDLKSIRPLKLFEPKVLFCDTLVASCQLISTQSIEGLGLADAKISAERVSFVAKVAEVDIHSAKVVAGAFGIQSDHIG
ncbi:hypothetical protein QVD99_006734 [Batrachochytrium dendrobatidis]|nr:hypothetical protein O5D80_005286 [Batrachochytrium dendrobatidis]KAK5666671.1 hypothetical protein QVD99_006734 [Batrachochytrium dendrobatidis]